MSNEKIIDLTCSNCGCQLISGLRQTGNTRIRVAKIYCSDCFYSVIQQNKHYRFRNDFLEKQNREHMLKSKEIRGIVLARAKSDNNKNFKTELTTETYAPDYSKDQEGIEE